MRLCALSLLLTVVALTPALRGEDHAALEGILRFAGYQVDNDALLGFFRERTLDDAERERLARLVEQLGSAVYTERSAASEALAAAGRKAVSLLRAATSSSDREVVRRARWCLRKIDDGPEIDLAVAAARLLAARRVEGALPVLLAYLPFLEEHSPEDELFAVIGQLGLTDGKPAPALLAALRGKPAQRRAAAGAMGRSSAAADRTLAAGLLHDPDVSVRYCAAEALLHGKDRRGLPVLIDLVEKGPVELAARAETALSLVAGEQAPTATVGPTADERAAAAAAWRRWWREDAPALNLARLDLDAALQGLRLVVANGGYGGAGAVWEFGGDHKTRWQMRQVGGPFDARALPNGRVLLAEYNERRVSERDRNNRIVWEYRPQYSPLEVQRLPGGNTLVVTNHDLVEVDRSGKTVFVFRDPPGNIFTGQKLANGNYLFGLYTGHVVEIDRTGRELHRFAVERPRGLANLVVLPGPRYLLPCASSHRIVEMDRTGKVLREIEVTSPTSVAVLPGGNYLVGSHVLSNVREVDRRGTLLWEQKAEGQVFRVRVR